MISAKIFQLIILSAIPVLLAITIHEAAHGYAARYFGDNTAWNLGRVTLNPLRHIDHLGTIVIPLALLLLGSPFVFGYAKPVPVRVDKLRHPQQDMMWVALAGPASNLLQALAWGVLFHLLRHMGVHGWPSIMCVLGIQINALLCAFNLFPLPPLDGGRVLVGLLPPAASQRLAQVEPYGFFIVLALAVTGVIGTLWLAPLTDGITALVRFVLLPLR